MAICMQIKRVQIKQIIWKQFMYKRVEFGSKLLLLWIEFSQILNKIGMHKLLNPKIFSFTFLSFYNKNDFILHNGMSPLVIFRASW
jgi:hypothetical protein